MNPPCRRPSTRRELHRSTLPLLHRLFTPIRLLPASIINRRLSISSNSTTNTIMLNSTSNSNTPRRLLAAMLPLNSSNNNITSA